MMYDTIHVLEAQAPSSLQVNYNSIERARELPHGGREVGVWVSCVKFADNLY